MSHLRTAVIGVGMIGSLHARIYAEDPRTTLVAVVDPSRGGVLTEVCVDGVVVVRGSAGDLVARRLDRRIPDKKFR